jgi:molybdopterin molybdotransferase
MISVEEAWQIVDEQTKALSAETISLTQCAGRVLAKDVLAPLSLPPFRQSAMDGYAVYREDVLENNGKLKIVAVVPAGATDRKTLSRGEAMRIFTGAPVPDGANFVVMQEYVTVQGQYITISEQGKCTGANIRTVGEELMEGTVALSKGNVISAAGQGFLSALGITTITCTALPKVSVLVTGDELVAPGQPLNYGQVYESNGATLEAALLSLHIQPQQTLRLPDQYEETKAAILNACETNDLLLISGGISVGDYDFVGKALQELGAKELIYKIQQKPGKPMYFGKLKTTTVFALPGNPASLLTCFYEYVYPVLRKMAGHRSFFMKRRQLRLQGDYHNKADRALFLKGRAKNDEVMVLEGQGSFMMQSFAQANCLIYLPALANVEEGNEVEVHFLPY